VERRGQAAGRANDVEEQDGGREPGRADRRGGGVSSGNRLNGRARDRANDWTNEQPGHGHHNLESHNLGRRSLVESRRPAAGRVNDGAEGQDGGKGLGLIIKERVALDEERVGTGRQSRERRGSKEKAD